MFVCVVVYSMSGMLLVCWALGINTVGHGEKGYIDKARQGSEGSDNPPEEPQSPQQLQVSADGLARSLLSSFIGSGNLSYNSTSVSWNQTIQLSESPALPFPASTETDAEKCNFSNTEETNCPTRISRWPPLPV